MHIFLSYAKADTRELALKLRDVFNSISGVTVWMDDSLEVARDWATQIEEEIDRCDYMVVLLSTDVNRPTTPRSFVLNEIHYARSVQKTIIPVMAQTTKVPVQLAGIEYIDLTDSTHGGINRLTNEISHRLKSNLTASFNDGNQTTRIKGNIKLIQDENLPILENFPNTQSITIKRLITTGQSGSQVLEVDATLYDTANQPYNCFLKIHHSQQGDTPRKRHEMALSNTNLRNNMPHIVDATAWDSDSKKIALLYSVDPAATRVRTLDSLLHFKLAQAISLIKQTCMALLEWNSTFVYEYSPIGQLLVRTLSHSEDMDLGLRRLEDPKASIPARLRDTFGLTSTDSSIKFENVQTDLPNPLAYLENYDNIAMWQDLTEASIAWPSGNVHGDMNPRNILLLEGAKKPLSLIDFDTYDGSNLLFLDFVQLELGIILKLCSPEYHNNHNELILLSEYLASNIELEQIPDLPIRSVGINEVIRPIREAIVEICNRHREFRVAYWIARIAVGLEFSRKKKAKENERIFALLLASHSLSKLLKYYDLIPPNGNSCVIKWVNEKEYPNIT
jgi:TIR domain/Ternary complex associated domain 9